MDNSMDKYLGQMLDNRYELLEVIGSGGMAVVYKALCHRLNRYVAVKILRDDMAMDEEYRRRFETESRAISMLSHPNIVAVYDVSKTDNPMYIVMELVDGITLKQYMTKRGALSWKEALHFSTQIAKALSHAHGKGIIHRDIKPHNIMLAKDGVIKVADFGIARLQDTQNTLINQEALGSVHYISPEQAKGEVVDARTDIYALGVVMYEMLTGQLPFEGDSAVSIAVQHINAIPLQPRDLNPDIPPALEAITMKAMNPNIEERYQSAEELLEDLENFRLNQTVSATPAVAQEDALVGGDDDVGDGYRIIPDVRPISRSGELNYEQYVRRRRRSKKVSMLSGFFIVLVFMIAVFVFLWNFFIRDIFADSEHISIPNFVGSNYEDIINNVEFQEIFNFRVVYAPDSQYDEGIIISQNPEAEDTRALTSSGIDVTLTVSSGIQMVRIPNVVNWDYRDAIIELEGLGLTVEPETVASDTITKDYVISTNPASGEELPMGSTIYVTISGGPTINTVTMPDLVGDNQSSAIAELESLSLTVGSITWEASSEYAYGEVTWQSIEPGEEVEELTKVYLRVSSGPAQEEESPSPSPTEAPPATTPVVTTPTVTDPPATTPAVTDPPAVTNPPDPTTPVEPPAEGGEGTQ